MSSGMFAFLNQLVVRLKSVILQRESSLENGISKREQALFFCAKELEECKDLKDEMGVRDKEFSHDGLEDV